MSRAALVAYLTAMISTGVEGLFGDAPDAASGAQPAARRRIHRRTGRRLTASCGNPAAGGTMAAQLHLVGAYGFDGVVVCVMAS